MIHQLTRARALALVMLALASLLTHATHAVTAQKRNTPQKKSSEAAKPDAPKTQQQTTTQTNGQTPTAQQLPPSILVRWQGRPGINRYRLQLATDEKFEDVVFDQAVEGRQYVVRDLPPGNYFWRVAPAAAETSATYSQPERVTLGNEQKVAESSVVMPAD